MIGGRPRRLFAGATLVIAFLVGAVVLSPTALATRLARIDPLPLLGILAVVYVVRPFVALPMSVLAVLIGFRFGLVGGYPIAIAGTAVTCYLPYAIGGRFREPDVTGGEGGLLAKIAIHGRQAVDVTGGLRAIVAARLSPAPADPVSYAAGLAAVRRRPYVLGTILGELPWMGLYVAIGTSAQSVSVANTTPDPIVLVTSVTAASALLFVPAIQFVRTRMSA